MQNQIIELDSVEQGYKRLQQFSQIYPEVAVYISEFIEKHPQFLPFLVYIPFQLKSQDQIYFSSKSVKQGILFYLCCAGVRYSFGKNLYHKVSSCKSLFDLQQINIPPGKVNSLSTAILLDENITLEQALSIKIQGIGIGGQQWLKQTYTKDFDLDNFQYTDICLQKGLQIIYNLPSRPTASAAKKIGETWGNCKGIGQLFCFQANSYHK